MEGISTEELLEMIDEMDEGDLMEVCDEVGLDWGALGSEEAMRAGLRSHYGIADDVVATGGDDDDHGDGGEEPSGGADDQEHRELIEMMDIDDTSVALAEEGIEIAENTLEWMQCALLAHFTGRPIPGPGARWGSGGGHAAAEAAAPATQWGGSDGGDDDYATTDVAAEFDVESLLQPEGTVVYSGYMSKVAAGKFHSKRKPKRLHFELEPSSLAYYDSPGGARLRGIDLRTAVDIRAKPSVSGKDREKDARAVQLVTPLRTWELLADDSLQAAEWIRVVKKQLDLITESAAVEANLDMDDDDVIENAFATFEKYSTPGADGEEILTKESIDDMLREEIGFAVNQEYVDTVLSKYDRDGTNIIDVDEFLDIYKFMWLAHVAHLRAFEEGDAGGDEDEDEVTKIGSKEWLAARKRHIIKKTSEEGFQDRAIRCIASAIAFVFMLLMLYGAIGLLSGDGVEQYPCETIQPCLNGAECSNSNPYGNSSYLCDCIDGWTGVNCGRDYDECIEIPCLNGGVCTNGRNNFDCQCARGFKGRNCDIDVNECDSSPCVRGVCGDLDGRYQCMCPPGFNGTECQLDRDECLSNPCQTGRCHDGFDRYTCVCDVGFSGRQCEVDNDECISRPCLNHGNCTARPAKEAAVEMILNQSVAFGGVNLSTARMAELSNLLRNAGVAHGDWDTSDSFTCKCEAGYTGHTCHEDVDECASEPCIHGICIDEISGYRCSCERDWEGSNCDVASAFAYYYEFETPSDRVAEHVITEMTALLELNTTIGEHVRDAIITSLYQGAIVSRDLVKITVETYSMQKAILVTTMLAGGTQLPAGWKFLTSNFESCDYRRLPRISVDSPSGLDVGRTVLLRETGAEMTGWTNTEITDVGSAGLVHGPWGNDVRDVQINIPVPAGLTLCQVSWRSWQADSRDGETDRVSVDGNEVWSLVARFGSCSTYGWTDGGTEFPDYPNPWGGQNGQVCYVDVEVEVPCNGGGNMNLRFQSSINQHENDESWAFQNVAVTGHKATTITDCITTHGYNLPLQTADGDLDVDLFILQDLSGSFRDDLISLRANVANMHALLSQIFRSPRIGFGGFIDKPTNSRPDIYCYDTFHDLADMTAEQMTDAFNNMEAMGNYDSPETSLSGLYAISKRAQLPDNHPEKLHFNAFMKVALLATDAGWKDEMTAEPAGVLRTRESTESCDVHGICEDGCDVFTIPPEPAAYQGDEPIWAYTDTTIVRESLQAADIVPLFAATTNQVSLYESLNQQLGGNGFVTSLASDSSNFDDTIVIGLGGILETTHNLSFPTECLPGDECISHPCQNGGVCTDDAYSPHICYCVGDYTGDDCQYEADDCCSYPCDNGADCSDLNNAYVCNCLAGYTGTNCAAQVEECSSLPCLNGAVCEDVSIDAYRCRCLAGWWGDECQEDVNECLSVPCLNHAECADSSDDATVAIDTFECTCRAGFRGVTCAEDVDECLSSPCLNSANCFDREDDFWCSCREGYSGALCENEADYCQSLPCLNEGSCNSLSTNPPTYACDCGGGYMGSNCHIDINECVGFEPGENSGCRNGGECSDSNADVDIPVLEYRCTCLAGFEGSNCETMVNPCLKGFETPLGHGCDLGVSTCVWSGPSSYACQCNAGFFLQEGSGHDTGWWCEEEFPWILFVGFCLLFCFLCTFFGFYAFQYRRMLRLPLEVGTLDVDDATQEVVDLDIRAMATDTVSALKGQIEIASGVLAREQRVFIVKDEQTTVYLEDDKCLSDYGIARHWSAPRRQDLGRWLADPFEIPFFVLPEKKLLKLQMMQCWQIFVKVQPREKSSDEEPIVVLLDVVVPHWRVESVKLKIEDKIGLKSQHQRLSHEGENILDGQRIIDYPAIKNMDTIDLVDETPPEKPKLKQAVAAAIEPKPKKMKADSVLSMAAMFQSGQAPGANLSELQERSMLQGRKKPGRGRGGGEGGGGGSIHGSEGFENPLATGRRGDMDVFEKE